VNSISPGIISTPMGRQELTEGAGEQMQGMLDLSPVPRIGTADDIAAAVQWLASRDASFVSGCDLRVDGGVTAAIHGLMAGG
jgi:NAD(P)-dependent dehydrogenase (short-subunit alcohol dehydrogenase family)